MANLISGIDLGIVSTIDAISIKTHVKKQLSGVIGATNQNMIASDKAWRIVGFLDNPSQSDLESLNALRDSGQVFFMDIADVALPLFGFGKISSLNIYIKDAAYGIVDYEIELEEVIGLCTVMMQTNNAFLYDLAYWVRRKWLNPLWTKSNMTINAARDEWQFEFYVNNDGSAQDIIFEIHCADYISTKHVQIEYWNGTVWTIIGDWGDAGVDVWGAIKAFTDPEAQAHDVIVNHATRGNTISNMTASMALGLRRRILVNIKTMAADDFDSTTVYGGDQLLLRVTIYSQSLNNPSDLQYVDGSIDYGRPNP